MLGNDSPLAGVWGTVLVTAPWVVPLIGVGVRLLRPLVPAVRPAPARVARR